MSLTDLAKAISVRWVRWIAVAALAVMPGCAVKLAYNNLDRFARWQTSDYIQMTREQRRFFDARFDEWWYWHRSTQLPRYAEYLDVLAGEVEAGFDDAAGARLEASVESWFVDGIDMANPLMAELLISLSDEQVDELADNLTESNETFLREEEDFDLVSSVEDNYKRFIGRLTADQKAYVAANADRYQPIDDDWIAYRERWQAALLDLTRRKPPLDDFVQELRQLTLERERWYDGEVQRVADANTALFRDIGNQVFATLSSQQRTRAVNRIQRYAEIFRELAAEAKPAGKAPEPAAG